MQSSRSYKSLWVALMVFAAVIILAVTGKGLAARYLASIYGIVVALILFVGMLRDIVHGKYGVDILAVVAIVSTVWIGEYWATMVIVLMMEGGEALEAFAGARARAELSSLLKRAPTLAHKQMVDGSTKDVPVEKIKLHDLVVVRPGELVPVDATVVMGESSLDESSLTGESLPVDVKVGDSVLSGAINGDSPLVIRAVRVASDSQYAQIVSLVKAASETQAPFVRMADRYAVPFTLVAFAIAGIAWWASGNPERFAEVLVVATPCPLLLAAPVAFISGMSRAAKHGIIIKNGGVIERLADVKAAAFDKTGTLTKGQLMVASIVSAKGNSEKDVLQAAVNAEQHSGHVTALAIMAMAKEQSIIPKTVRHIDETPGGGIMCKVGNHMVYAGKREFLIKHGVPASTIKSLQKTATYIARNKHYIGAITYSDTLRPDSKQTLHQLKRLGVTRFVMLTGDHQQAADVIAKQLGITDVKAECLPADKVTVVKDFPVRPIMMTGDGINDAPVLAASDVGIAMGARGATAASESADVVIMLDQIKRVAMALAIASHTVLVARRSVQIGIGLSILLMIVATTGIIPPVTGAILQEFVDVTVILYALRAHTSRSPL